MSRGSCSFFRLLSWEINFWRVIFEETWHDAAPCLVNHQLNQFHRHHSSPVSTAILLDGVAVGVSWDQHPVYASHSYNSIEAASLFRSHKIQLPSWIDSCSALYLVEKSHVGISFSSTFPFGNSMRISSPLLVLAFVANAWVYVSRIVLEKRYRCVPGWEISIVAVQEIILLGLRSNRRLSPTIVVCFGSIDCNVLFLTI